MAAAPARAVGASPNCAPASTSTGHCYAITEMDGLNQSPNIGGHLSVALNWMQSGPNTHPNQYFVTNEMWVDFDGPSATAHNFIEAGEYNGYLGANNSNSGGTSPIITIYEANSGASAACLASGCQAYALFWADHTYNASTGVETEYLHVVKTLAPNGATEYVDILWNWDGHNDWSINFTGNVTYYGASTIEGAWQRPDHIQWGSEVYAPANNGACIANSTDTAEVWQEPRYTIRPDPDTWNNSFVRPYGAGLNGTGSSTGNGWWTVNMAQPCP